MKIRTSRPKTLFHIFISLICIVGSLVILFPLGIGIIKWFREYGVWFGLLISSAGIVFCLLMLWIVYFVIQKVRLEIKILSFSIEVESKNIALTFKNFEYRIPQEKISHVLAGNNGAMIIWQVNQILKTFFVNKSYFATESYKELVTSFKSLQGYTEDFTERKKIRQENRLNHIFRKNKLELEL
jgi:hypothetical protein